MEEDALLVSVLASSGVSFLGLPITQRRPKEFPARITSIDDDAGDASPGNMMPPSESEEEAG